MTETSLSSRLIRFSNWNLWFYPVQFIIGFVSSVYVTRVVGSELYGSLSVYLALTTLLAIFSDLGITGGITKFAPEYKKNGYDFRSYFFTITGVRFFLFSVLAGALYFKPGLFSGGDTLNKAYFPIILITVGLQMMADLVAALHLANLHNKPIQLSQTLGALTLPILVFIFAKRDIGTVLWLYAGAGAIRSFTLLFSLKHQGLTRGRAEHPANIVRRNIHNGFSKILFMVLRYAFDLGFLFLVFAGPKHIQMVGFASLANRLLSYALNLSAFPLNQMQETLFAHLFARKDDHALMQKVYNLLSKYTTVFTVPLLMFFAGYGPHVIKLFYGKTFLPSADFLSILALTMAGGTVFGAANKMLIQFEEHRFFNFLSGTLLTLITSLLYYCQIHSLFILAFYGLAMLRLLYYYATHAYLVRKWHLQLDSRWIWKTALCNLVWFIPALAPSHMNPWLLLPVSVISFLILQKILRLFDDVDKSYFAQLALPGKRYWLALL
jgi:O-antigen/teichoic acid export membrane protein